MSATTRRATALPVPPAQTPRWVAPAALVLAVAGLAVSAYLTVEHYTASTTLACPDTGVVNCQKVTTSAQSHVFGIPVAVLGLVYFAAMAGLNLPQLWRDPPRRLHQARLAAAGLGPLFALYLLTVELFVVNAICLWCTAVHVLALALFATIALGTAVVPAGLPAAGPRSRG